jgi:hypothetical protein
MHLPTDIDQQRREQRVGFRARQPCRIQSKRGAGKFDGL